MKTIDILPLSYSQKIIEAVETYLDTPFSNVRYPTEGFSSYGRTNRCCVYLRGGRIAFYETVYEEAKIGKDQRERMGLDRYMGRRDYQ